MSDTFGFIGLIGALFIGLLTPLLGLAAILDHQACGAQSRAMNFPHQWGPFKGCMIKVGGQWIPLEAYRVNLPVTR